MRLILNTLRILCLFCRYATALKDYFLLRYFFKYDFNSVSKFVIIVRDLS